MTCADPDGFDFSALEVELGDLQLDGVVNVNAMQDMALLDLYRECGDELQTLQEEMVPRTDRGREVHSLRAACVVELKQRGLL